MSVQQPEETLGDSVESQLRIEFEQRLQQAVAEVRKHTRIGLRSFIADIQTVGGLEAAKKCLRARNHVDPHPVFDQPSPYLVAAKRVGRLDLSIEALAVEPRWRHLFNQQEIDEATATLREEGFQAALGLLYPGSAYEMQVADRELMLARSLRPDCSFQADWTVHLILGGSPSVCEFTAEAANALRQTRTPKFSLTCRKHVEECESCRDAYPDLVNLYKEFDRQVLHVWLELLKIFRSSLELGDDALKRLTPFGPEDDEDSDVYEVDLDSELTYVVRPICTWRAVRLGCYIGQYMSAFAATFDTLRDPWLMWRKGEGDPAVTATVCAMDRDLFVLSLLARNLLMIRDWPFEEESLLWLPTDGDLSPIPGFVQVENTSDMDEWEEVLGEVPQNLNPAGMLYLARCAAISQWQDTEVSTPEELVHQAAQDQWNRMEELLREIHTGQAQQNEKQDAMINLMEKMANYMPSTDRQACEAALLDKLPDVWGKLSPEARTLLLASEQNHRTPGFAAPAQIVHGLATAFEKQVHKCVTSGLFEFLKQSSVKSIRPLLEWTDVEKRDRPLWSPSDRAEKCTLGTLRLILRHPQPEIGEFFQLVQLDRSEIRQAVDAVHFRRNPAAHGEMFDIGTAEAIRGDWFRWNGRPGGIFAALFRNG